MINDLERTSKNIIMVVFVNVFDETLNKPSEVSFGAWATVGNEKSVIIIKESRSKSSDHALQDVGYNVCNSSYPQHYNLSNSQYDELFGQNNWEKVYMDFDEFQNWKKDRKLLVDENANKRQEESWKSTGHR